MICIEKNEMNCRKAERKILNFDIGKVYHILPVTCHRFDEWIEMKIADRIFWNWIPLCAMSGIENQTVRNFGNDY